MMRKTLANRFFLAALCVLAALICCACRTEPAEPAPSEPPESPEPPRSAVLVFRDGHEETVTLGPEEELRLPFDRAEPGYRCYAWTDETGARIEAVTGAALPARLTQRCTVILSDEKVHRAYFFPDEDGNYATDEGFTRRQAARMFEALLVPKQADSGAFADLDETDAAFAGALLLRAYGMETGERFFPDRVLTRGELLCWLSFCFPPAETEPSLDGIDRDGPLYPAMCLAAERGWIDPEAESPDEPLSGRELLFLMNRVLGREAEIGILPAEAYASAVDYLDEPALFAALLEAGVTHACSALRPERWEEFTVLRRLEEGPRRKDGSLLWVCGDGLFAVDREVNGLLFDERGRYTSGDPELDACVREILNEILDDDMTQYEQLRAVYDYCLHELRYGRGGVFEKGTDDWWREEGLRMLTGKRGNCYSFAAAFCALSRPLGYDTKVTSGSTFGQGIHGWAYIMFGGEEHIFDPQSEQVAQLGCMFDLTPEQWAKYQYEPVYSGQEETA